MIGFDLRFRTHSSGSWVWTGRREVMGRWGQEGQLGLLQWTSERTWPGPELQKWRGWEVVGFRISLEVELME